MRKKNIYLVIMTISLLLIGFLAWTLFLAPAENQDGQPGYNQSGADKDGTTEGNLTIPGELLGAQKTDEQSGPAAIAAISQMHRTNINVLNAYIVSYGKTDAQITLWLSVSPTVDEAEQLFRVMDEKVPASSVFTGRTPVTLAGREVIKVNGMGQEHFYWQDGQINYWVAIQGEADRNALIQDVMDNVK